MPTGYTAAVQDGKITTLRDYALQCARAFGATIEMRDAPSDAPIPERFEPGDYNAKELAKAQDRLTILPKMSPVECDLAAEADHREALAAHVESARRRRETKLRYEDMLDQVERWKPDPMLASLRDFMLEQLRSALDFDCDERYRPEPPIRLTGEIWRVEQLVKASRDVAYHTKAHQEEVERTEGRNRWIAALRASLPDEVAS